MGSFPHSCNTYSDCTLLCPQRACPMLGRSSGSSLGGSRQEQRCHTPAHQPFRLPHGLQQDGLPAPRGTWASPWAPVLRCTSREARRPLGFQNHVRRGRRRRWGCGTWKQVLARQTPLPSTMVPGSLGWEPPGGGSSVGPLGEEQRMLCVVWGEPPGAPSRAGAGQDIHSPLQFGNVSPVHLQAPFLSSCPAGATGDVTVRGLL